MEAAKRLVPVVLVLMLVGCSDPNTGVSTFINVGVSNSTSVELTVDISVAIGEGSGTTITAAPGYTSTEVNGTSGNVVTFNVRGALAGEGFCTATNQIVGTSTYGEVNILETGGGTAQVTCLFGWAESP